MALSEYIQSFRSSSCWRLSSRLLAARAREHVLKTLQQQRQRKLALQQSSTEQTLPQESSFRRGLQLK